MATAMPTGTEMEKAIMIEATVTHMGMTKTGKTTKTTATVTTKTRVWFRLEVRKADSISLQVLPEYLVDAVKSLLCQLEVHTNTLRLLDLL
jgi:hypothetical protein